MQRFTYRLILLLSILLLRSFPSSAGESIVIRPQLDTTVTSYYPFECLRRPRIGLVLSGGGARGATQIGVLKVLERHHIPVDFIAATSMGAIVGGLYASGYTTTEIESLALNTDWEDVLSLTEDTKRTELFVDQKLQDDRSFLVVRFEGLAPVIPSAISSGQRLTDYLSTQALQAIYQPHPSFDDLKVRFRAVTTDLISGKRVIIDRGSLAEALRGSATVPMVFTPLKRDSMQLIDGGLVSNIPVDVARKEGLDIVIAVNSTSGLRSADELRAPWQTADQIMGIMMQQPNAEALKDADVVITPRLGKHLSSDFRGLDSLIARGEEAAEAVLPQIRALMGHGVYITDSLQQRPIDFSRARIEIEGKGIPDSLISRFNRVTAQRTLSMAVIRDHLNAIISTGGFHNVYASVDTGADALTQEGDSNGVRVRYHAEQNPRVTLVTITGTRVMPVAKLLPATAGVIGLPIKHRAITTMTEEIVRHYRKEGYSLARVESVSYDVASGVLSLQMNEGTIHEIDVEGGVRAKDSFVLREFPLQPGDVFQIDEANRGVTNISSTTLFEYVYLEVEYSRRDPVLTIRLKERPSQLVRFGMRADDERNLQGSIDIRDENFQGLGTELGLNINGGARNREAVLEFKAHRLFDTYLTFNLSAFYSLWDDYYYGDDPIAGPNRWDRQRLGEYRDERLGGRLTFGMQLEKFGNATIDYSLQEVHMKNKENAEGFRDRFRLSTVRIGTVIDSKDSYPFAREGFGANISYEFSLQNLGSEVGFNVVRFKYESYTTWGERHTLHPKFTFGFADKTMPLAEQFRLGGRESLFGTREADRRGRQLFLFNLEYRYFLPVRLIFESYIRLRFDMGSISDMPEQLKLATVRYGLGTELALDTPIGPAAIGIGKSFYFGRDLPANPFLQGPFLLYFAMGYQL